MSKPIPDRDDLLEQLRRANSSTFAWVTIRLIAVVTLAALIDWRQVLLTPIVTGTACLVLIGPFMMELLTIWGQKKKRRLIYDSSSAQ